MYCIIFLRGDIVEGYTIIVLIFGVICLLMMVMIYFINRLFQYKTRIDNSFIAIKDNLVKRTLIVEDMINFLETNLEHEKSYQKKLIKAKDLVSIIKNNEEGIKLIKKTESDILGFVNLENTYKNLVKIKEYTNIKDEILKNNEQLIYAMDSYDKGVISYNDYRRKKFIYILSKLCKIPEYSCYNK